jgi:hypothetical protein
MEGNLLSDLCIMEMQDARYPSVFALLVQMKVRLSLIRFKLGQA